MFFFFQKFEDENGLILNDESHHIKDKLCISRWREIKIIRDSLLTEDKYYFQYS